VHERPDERQAVAVAQRQRDQHLQAHLWPARMQPQGCFCKAQCRISNKWAWSISKAGPCKLCMESSGLSQN
jgi:hypothetical protein